jgi:hypothetical protein
MALQLKKLDPELKAILEIRPRVRLKIFLIKQQHLKRLEELSLKSAGQTPQLEEPNEEQLQWVERKMKGSARTWQTWNEGIYFTEEQKGIK